MAEEKVVAEAEVESKPAAKQEKNHRSDRPERQGRRPGNKPGANRFEKQYEERVVAINRVSKTVKGGRHQRFAALVVVGDGKGNYGFGTGKASEVPDAIKKAVEAAKRNMSRVTIVKGGTISHEIIGKYGACKVFLKPAPDGTGSIAGGPVRAILELAGVKNIYSKVYGSRTAINCIRATVDGLNNLKTTAQINALRK